MDIKNALLGSSIVTTGLMSGLWYAWAVSVIPGTRRIPDTTYITTMQNVNKAIINPAFIIPFMGIPVVLGGAALVQFRAGDSRRGWLLVAAAASYVVGVLGGTIAGNVPLNDALEAFDLAGRALVAEGDVAGGEDPEPTEEAVPPELGGHDLQIL